MVKLRPCPFCGQQAELVCEHSVYYGTKDNFIISCTACECELNGTQTLDVVKLWNTRNEFDELYNDNIALQELLSMAMNAINSTDCEHCVNKYVAHKCESCAWYYNNCGVGEDNWHWQCADRAKQLGLSM